MSHEHRIEVRQRIDAPREVIWEACSSPEGLARWQADEAEGNATLGGELTLRWEAFSAVVELTVVAIDPGRRIVMQSGDSQVTLQLDDGSVTLTHVGAEVDDEDDGLESSWRIALAQLAHSVERHPGIERRVHWMVRPARTNTTMAYMLFSEATGLGMWLTRSGEIGPTGSRFELKLRSGATLRGTVLANIEGHDIVLACDNYAHSTLTLRSLPSPMNDAQRLVALVWSEWGDPHPRADAVTEELCDALDTLGRALESSGSA